MRGSRRLIQLLDCLLPLQSNLLGFGLICWREERFIIVGREGVDDGHYLLFLRHL